MDILSGSRLLVFCFFLVNGVAMAQYIDEPKPLFYIWERSKSGDREDHVTFLTRNIPGENDCKTTWGVFYFRVTGDKVVDSLYYAGTLNKSMNDQVIKNIYSTQGHWKVPAGTRNTRKYWFVYSYFSFGPYNYANPACSPFEGALQKNIIELAENLLIMSRYTGNKDRFILPPTLVGSEYPQE